MALISIKLQALPKIIATITSRQRQACSSINSHIVPCFNRTMALQAHQICRIVYQGRPRVPITWLQSSKRRPVQTCSVILCRSSARPIIEAILWIWRRLRHHIVHRIPQWPLSGLVPSMIWVWKLSWTQWWADHHLWWIKDQWLRSYFTIRCPRTKCRLISPVGAPQTRTISEKQARRKLK